MSQPDKLPYRHQIVIEPVTPQACPAGVRTLIDLTPGLAAVLERLQYGAGKHPDEPWKTQAIDEHAQALIGHCLALADCKPPLGSEMFDALAADPDIKGWTIQGQFVSREDVVAEGARRHVTARKHLAALVARALMALTRMDEKEEPSSQPDAPKGEIA